MKPIVVKKPKSTVELFKNVIFTRREGLKPGGTIPRIDVQARGWPISQAKLNKYNKVCGFPVSDRLPITFPHIMAFPLHIEAMMAENFPLPAVGLVHVRNVVEELRPLNPSMTFDFDVWIEGHREVDAGIEFDTHTEVRAGGELVWRGISTTLRRGKSSGGGKKKQPAPPPAIEAGMHIENWRIPEDMGRRYGAASGDQNPIHLYPFSAKLLGFKQHIVHGMWTKARVMAALEEYRPEGPYRLSVQFKLPVFLPGKVQLQAKNKGKTTTFEVRDGKGVKPHMVGTLEPIKG